MKIAVVGTGYVGLVSGTCFSEFGFDVTCVDKDAAKIERLQRYEIPIYEPGLDTLVEKNARAGRLTFTTDLKSSVEGADVVCIAVGTPTRKEDGRADLSYVYAAARELAPALAGYTAVVIKSTVPVGTGRQVGEIIREANPKADFDMVSNPEFLREGSAVDDFLEPDRVIVGVESERAREAMAEVYRPLTMNEVPLMFTDIQSSELTKYAANTFLAMKITFINEIADLCEQVGANVRDIAKGMGIDQRIGARFLQPGPGYGGSCFPKDTLALVHQARDAGSPMKLVEATVELNEARKVKMAEKIVAACGDSVKDKTVALLGLTFKPDTDDVRDSSALVIAHELVNAGATVRAYDPKGMEEARKLLGDRIAYCKNAYEAAQGADALAIVTEWNEFKSLDLLRLKQALKSAVVVDLRNIYKRGDMARAGFQYVSIGRTFVAPQPKVVKAEARA